MGAGTLSSLKAARANGLVSAIAMDAVVGTAIGLTMPLLSFGLEQKGASAILIGLNGAVAAIAAMVTAPLTPALVTRFGLRPMALAGLLLGAASVLGFHLFQTIAAWFVLRFLLGVCLTILFVISEFWIVSVAPADKRGLVMGVYATILSLGFAAGPTVLALTGTQGFAPFFAGMLLFLVGTIPILMSGPVAPGLDHASSASMLQVLVAAPSATLAAVMFGAVESGTMTFLPLYGMRLGFDEIGAAALLSSMGLGNLLIQIPLGLLSDRIDRRWILLGLGLVATLGAALMPLAGTSAILLHLLLFLWGGVIAGFYTVGLAHLGARFCGPELAKANSAFVFCYSLGMLVGPPALGLGMQLWPPHGAIVASALMLGAYSAFVLHRILAAQTGR